MEKLAKLLSIVAAGCFIISAAYLAGYLTGIEHSELGHYVTFSDVVNYAFGTIWPLAAFLAVLIVFDKRFIDAIRGTEPENASPRSTGTARPRWLETIITSLVATVCGFLGIFMFHHRAAAVIMVVTIFTVGIVLFRTRDLVATAYGVKAAKWLEVMFSVVSAAICVGLGLGATARENSKITYVTTTDTGTLQSRNIMPLDRGLVVFGDNDSVKIVPWSEVKQIVELPDPVKNK